VCANLLEVQSASRLSRPCSCPSNHRADTRLLQIDNRVFRCDVVFVLEALEVALDVGGEESIARLLAAPAGVFSGLDTETVLSALGLLDINGSDPWNLEGTQSDERTELDDEVVALAVRRPPEILDLTVGEPHFVLIAHSSLANTNSNSQK